jgi:hypothetical protein
MARNMPGAGTFRWPTSSNLASCCGVSFRSWAWAGVQGFGSRQRWRLQWSSRSDLAVPKISRRCSKRNLDLLRHWTWTSENETYGLLGWLVITTWLFCHTSNKKSIRTDAKLKGGHLRVGGDVVKWRTHPCPHRKACWEEEALSIAVFESRLSGDLEKRQGVDYSKNTHVFREFFLVFLWRSSSHRRAADDRGKPFSLDGRATEEG